MKRLVVTIVAVFVVALTGPASAGAAPAPDPWPQVVSGGYNPLTPTRLVDTRSGIGGAALGARETRRLDLVALAGVPREGLVALALNVTAVTPTADTFLRVWDGHQPMPGISNVNAPAGWTVANQVFVGERHAEETPEVAIYNHDGTTHLVVDITGYYATGEAAEEVAVQPVDQPQRVVDTRSGLATTGRLGPGETRAIDVEAGALAVNVTAVNPTADGFLTVWTGAPQRPATSTLNLTSGLTVAGLTVLEHGNGGPLYVHNSSGTVDIVIDVVGYWFRPGNAEPKPALPRQFQTVPPTRLADTRDGAGAPLTRGETRRIAVAERAGLPSSGIGAVLLTVVAVRPSAPTHLTVWSGEGTPPLISTLNAPAGAVVTNSVHAEVGVDGTVAITNFDGDTHVVVDVVGWYTSEPARVTAGELVVDDLDGVTVVLEPGVVHTLTLSADAGDDVHVWTTNGPTSDAHPVVRLVAPDGSAVTPTFNSVVAPVTGTYTVDIVPLGRRGGAVVARAASVVTVDGNVNDSAGTVFDFGDRLGSIDVPITIAEPTTLTVEQAPDTGRVGAVLSPTGRQVHGSAPSGTRAYELTEPGTYRFRMTRYPGSPPGSETVSLSTAPIA